MLIFMPLKLREESEMKDALKHQDIFTMIQEGFVADAVLQAVPLVTYVEPEALGGWHRDWKRA